MARPLSVRGATLRIAQYDGNIVTFQFVLQVRQFIEISDDSQTRMLTCIRVACITYSFGLIMFKRLLG